MWPLASVPGVPVAGNVLAWISCPHSGQPRSPHTRVQTFMFSHLEWNTNTDLLLLPASILRNLCKLNWNSVLALLLYYYDIINNKHILAGQHQHTSSRPSTGDMSLKEPLNRNWHHCFAQHTHYVNLRMQILSCFCVALYTSLCTYLPWDPLLLRSQLLHLQPAKERRILATMES